MPVSVPALLTQSAIRPDVQRGRDDGHHRLHADAGVPDHLLHVVRRCGESSSMLEERGRLLTHRLCAGSRSGHGKAAPPSPRGNPGLAERASASTLRTRASSPTWSVSCSPPDATTARPRARRTSSAGSGRARSSVALTWVLPLWRRKNVYWGPARALRSSWRPEDVPKATASSGRQVNLLRQKRSAPGRDRRGGFLLRSGFC